MRLLRRTVETAPYPSTDTYLMLDRLVDRPVSPLGWAHLYLYLSITFLRSGDQHETGLYIKTLIIEIAMADLVLSDNLY